MAPLKEPNATRRWVRILLFVSLAVNLLVVGAVAGFLIKGPPGGRDMYRDPVLPYIRAFDDAQRKDLRREMRGVLRRDEAGEKPDYRAAYEAVLSVLRAEPFDKDALESLLVTQARHGAEVRRAGQRIMTDYLAELTPDARRAYADRLAQELQAMRQRGPRGKPDGTQDN